MHSDSGHMACSSSGSAQLASFLCSVQVFLQVLHFWGWSSHIVFLFSFFFSVGFGGLVWVRRDGMNKEDIYDTCVLMYGMFVWQ